MILRGGVGLRKSVYGVCFLAGLAVVLAGLVVVDTGLVVVDTGLVVVDTGTVGCAGSSLRGVPHSMQATEIAGSCGPKPHHDCKMYEQMFPMGKAE